jgi:hypothetical protein
MVRGIAPVQHRHYPIRIDRFTNSKNIIKILHQGRRSSQLHLAPATDTLGLSHPALTIIQQHKPWQFASATATTSTAWSPIGI